MPTLNNSIQNFIKGPGYCNKNKKFYFSNSPCRFKRHIIQCEKILLKYKHKSIKAKGSYIQHIMYSYNSIMEDNPIEKK